MQNNEQKRYGFIGTVIFHSLLILLLIYSGFSRIVPQDEEGLAVSLGADDLGGSDLFEPTPASEIEGDLAPQTAEAPEPVAAEEPVQTQDIEESAPMVSQEQKKKEQERRQQQLAEERKRKAEEELRRKKEAEQRAIREEQERKAREIGARTKNVFGSGGSGGTGNDASSTGKGTGEGSGSQGKATGDPSNSPSSGYAKTGNNNSWSLAGRSIVGKIVEPSYSAQVEGQVVVDIKVNKNGDVVAASVGVGTNISSSVIQKAAIQAAKSTHFNAISEDKFQFGKITYTFNLK